MRDTSHNAAERRCPLLVAAQRSTRSLRAPKASPHGLASALVLLFAIASAWSSSSARAEPELLLRWQRPAGADTCPDQAWAEARIAEQLGRTPRPDVARGVNAEVAIEAGLRGFVLTLTTRFQGQVGSRTLEGVRCDELSEAATLVISLSVSEASEQISAAPQPPPPTPAAEPPSAPSSAKTPAPSRTLGGALRVDALMQVGLWERVVFGPGLALGLSHGVFRAEITGYWYPPLSVEQQGRQIEASLGAARLMGCALFGSGRVRGGPCVSAELGRATSDNRADTGRKDHTLWSAATLGGRMQVQLAWRLSLVVAADLLVGLTQLRFTTLDENGDRQSLGESKPLQLRASLGPELRF